MVSLKATPEALLADVRSALRKRVSEERRPELSQAFGAWILCGAGGDSEFASLTQEAAGREGAQQDFHTVAILGFGANAGVLGAIETEALKKGLRRQAGRAVVIDDMPAAFCSDAVGVLGVVLGTKALDDPDIIGQVSNWTSQFLKRSYGADHTEDWERCLFAAADLQLWNSLGLSVPPFSSVGDVRTALVARGVIPQGCDGTSERDAQWTIDAAMTEMPDQLHYDRAALRLAAIEHVLRTAIPVVGGTTVTTNKTGHPLSERDRRVHDAIGSKSFRTLTNAEIIKRSKTILHREGLKAESDATKNCLDRIRKGYQYPLSRQISKKRAERN